MNNPQCSGGRPLYRFFALQLAASPHLSKCHVCTTPWGVFALVLALFSSASSLPTSTKIKSLTKSTKMNPFHLDREYHVRTFTIFRYLTRQFVFHLFHIWLKLARALEKSGTPCASSNHLGVQVIQSQKAWANLEMQTSVYIWWVCLPQLAHPNDTQNVKAYQSRSL